jgi:hypothetical protein
MQQIAIQTWKKKRDKSGKNQNPIGGDLKMYLFK